MRKYIQSYTTQALFISFLLLNQFFFSQVKVTYEVTYKPDSTESKFNKEEMSLKHFNGKSYFYNETKFKLDSIYDRVTAEFLRTGITPNVSLKYELNFGIYKDLTKEEIYEIQNISSKNFMFKINLNKKKWNIGSDTKKIHNYNCKKATIKLGGRLWEAWFTDEIPINDGPYKFFGLPGLILEIYDNEKNYHFSAIGISKQNENFKLSSQFIKTSQDSFIKLKNKLINDPALFVRESIMKSNNIKMKGTDGNNLEPSELYNRITKEFNNFIKTHNNPIEKNTTWIK